MNDLNKSTARKPDVPEEMQARWQRILDLMARILNVTAAAITKADPSQIEVFLTSFGEGNPFRKGERSKLEAGLYCERVVRERVPLLIPDALKDPEWKQSPMIGMGMTYYLGFPLLWSDGEVFGSMCIFDRKDNPQATQFQEWVSQIRQLIEKDLCTLVEIGDRENLLAELQRHRDHLQEMVAEQTAELEKSKEVLEDRVRFENLIADLSASFVNVPPDRVDDHIAIALDQICNFFGADQCGLLKVQADRRQVHFMNMTQPDDRQLKFRNVDMASGHPWVYHQLVERGEPIIFSSLEALPPEASVDRATLEQEGIQAVLMLPLRVGEQVTHLIGLFGRHIVHDWPAVHIRRLRVLGEIFAKALVHRRAQKALLKSERGLAEAQRVSHVGSWDWDIRGGTHHWSDEFCRIFGLPPQETEATYEAFLASVHPDDRQAVHRANQESISDPDKPYSIEYRVVRPDGTQRLVDARADVLFDKDRRAVRMIGTLQDITARKQQEAEASAAQIRLRMALEAADMVTWEWDIPTGSFRYSDNIQAIVRGEAVERYCSLNTVVLEIHPEDREGLVQALDRTRKQGTPFECEYRVHMLDGTYRWILGKGKRVLMEDGKPIRVLGLSMDITERKRGEEELKKALDEIKKLKEQLEAENLYLREEVELEAGFKDIIGVSNPIKYVMHRIQQVARTKTTVLLTGETGTGKGLFARALHEASDRKEKPFVHVNCAGLPPNLIESELFGREKGAFTGSTARQIGRFELANGGTIFLDEIGELLLDLQAKLLKVIEDGEFERLGSPHPVKVDVRIIASTNRNLEEEVKKGQFRSDLFYRLNVFPITIPPLRQKREDIPLLVKFFADKFSKGHGKPVKRIPVNTMKVLENYTWPGNVRELMNVIERAVIVSEGPELRLAEKIDAIPLTQQRETARVEEKTGTKGLSEVQREHILRTLKETGWKIEGDKGAAQLLGMNPSTLRARMRKLSIKRPGT